MAEYEVRTLTLPAGTSTRQAREVLGIHAEYGEWELLKHALFAGGVRKVTVRRKVRAEPMPPLHT